MKFQLVINMERMTPARDMREVERHTLEMVQMADEGGFDIRLGGRASRARNDHRAQPVSDPDLVGRPHVPYPARLGGGRRGVLASDQGRGRLEFGIGSGAYQREFDRMRPGLMQAEGYRYVHEMLPAVKALWQGDYAHDGEFWSFPAATSVPKPLQKPHPPIWIAARSPITYDFAVKNECNILSWAMTKPMSEVELYKGRMETALADNPGKPRPIFATMRHTAVYERREDWEVPVKAVVRQLGQFENLFKNLGDVAEGFPKAIDLSELEHREQYDPRILHRNLLFGIPEEVIAKLRLYDALGVDHFTYNASLGLGPKEQKRSLALFIEEVMPAFA